MYLSSVRNLYLVALQLLNIYKFVWEEIIFTGLLSLKYKLDKSLDVPLRLKKLYKKVTHTYICSCLCWFYSNLKVPH